MFIFYLASLAEFICAFNSRNSSATEVTEGSGFDFWQWQEFFSYHNI